MADSFVQQLGKEGLDFARGQLNTRKSTRDFVETISDGVLLTGIELDGSTANIVKHNLGRVATGVLIAASSAFARFSYNSTLFTEAEISLASDAATTVSIWVF